MKKIIVLTLVLLAGCVPSRQATLPGNAPELISMSPLPVYNANGYLGDMSLEVVFHVRIDGTIADVDFVRSSGDELWDRTAIDSMRKWQFTPIPHGDSADVVMVRSRVIVHVETSAVMALGMLAAGTEREADSLYAELQRGVEFESLAAPTRRDSPSHRGRFIGSVDIGRYPLHIRSELRRLSINDATSPLRLGTEYVIFKRFPETQAMAQ